MSDDRRDAERYRWIITHWDSAVALWHNLHWDGNNAFGAAIDQRIVEDALLSSAGWTEWSGGEAPPVDRKAKVIVRLRDGREAGSKLAGYWIWSHSGRSDDIVAYKALGHSIPQ
jgi:hypothetical protein